LSQQPAVEVTEREAARVTFGFSSFIEMVLSLQVLCDPGRHGVLLPWVIRFKEKISPEAYDDIFAYGELLGDWATAIPPALQLPEPRDLSVPGVLHSLEQLSGTDYSAEFEARPERWREFLRFMWAYWTDYFHEEFYWIEPLLVSSIRQRAAKVGTGPVALLRELAPTVAGELEPRLEAGSKVEIRLVPSVFCILDRILGNSNGTLTACYPVSPGVYRRPENLAPPEPLARLLKTLSDETRLKMLKLILQERKCARDLAGDLELAEPTVCRHLRRLRDAELVETVAQGNFIYYTARLERIAELHMKVLDFLRS